MSEQTIDINNLPEGTVVEFKDGQSVSVEVPKEEQNG
jgi:hypothetical protein